MDASAFEPPIAPPPFPPPADIPRCVPFPTSQKIHSCIAVSHIRDTSNLVFLLHFTSDKHMAHLASDKHMAPHITQAHTLSHLLTFSASLLQYFLPNSQAPASRRL